MPPNDPESTNPFVRFKHRVDDQISQTVRSIWSVPSSSDNKIRDEGVARTLRDAWPTTNTSSDDSSSTALTKDENINSHGNSDNGSPTSREFAALESAISHTLRDETVQSTSSTHPPPPPPRRQCPRPLHLPRRLRGPTSRELRPTARRPRRPRRAPPTQQRGPDGPLARAAAAPGFTVRPQRQHHAVSLARRARRLAGRRGAPRPLGRLLQPARGLPARRAAHRVRRDERPVPARALGGPGQDYIRNFIGDAAACEEERMWRRAQRFLGVGGWGGGSSSSPTLGELMALGGPAGFPFGKLLGDDDTQNTPLAGLLAWGARVLESAERDARRPREADTSEDLYRNVESDYARNSHPRSGGSIPESSRDWPEPIRDWTLVAPPISRDVTPLQRGGETGKNDNSNNKSENAEWTEEFPEPDGGKTVKSVARKVGPWMTHETVKTTRYDADGNVVQRMTQSQHLASKEFKWSSGSGSEDEEKQNKGEDKSSSGKGWFWTK
ncbi:hypothetical protein PG994_004014 [Apiospora phragmitis]|uniref:Uncharacterized protein n=1 Tax=Apiospora phragmitis TaxID=2905665 RepID=A0ABR1VZR3_9PEZI